MSVWILRANARQIPLRDGCVQCVVTSPPYWGLRKYAGDQNSLWGGDSECQHQWKNQTKAGISGGLRGVKSNYEPHRFVPESTHGICLFCGAWRGSFGLEPTIELYIQHTVEILREIRRVLRPDGAVFWNIGDSYCSGAYSPRTRENRKTLESRALRTDGRLDHAPRNWTIDANKIARNGIPAGLKPKDLCLIPARVALAAQADGWWVRSLIIWAKPNPMPESCRDRPTDAYEHIILLTKSERYFWDADAVREVTGREASWEEYEKGDGHHAPPGNLESGKNSGFGSKRDSLTHPSGRNMRNVWTFSTQAYKGAHFATFPEEIPRRAILAATSERGCCSGCGAPWKRVVDVTGGVIGKSAFDHSNEDVTGKIISRSMQKKMRDGSHRRETTGWRPGCKCEAGEPRPCLVLDPFGGSGTTGRVAVELNRRAVLLDLAYHDHAQARTKNVQRRLAAL